MKKILLFTLLILLTFSCSFKRKVVKNTEENRSTNSELRINEETIDIRLPKRDISIFDQILFNPDGTFIPRIRTVNIPETNQTLEYQISNTGEIKIRSIAPPDTIRKKNVEIVENISTDESIKINEDIDTNIKFNLGGFLKNILNTFIPGLGDLFDGVFKIIGGIVTFVGIIILIIIIVIVRLIRRVFKKKE
jgi:hypothetical protein